MFNIVLLEPEIPANTQNIGRTCVCTNSKLHLIEPLGFNLSQKNISRAGLDYWDRLQYEKYLNFKDFITKNNIENDYPNVWFATTKAHYNYTEIKFNDNDFIIFGKESKGIPEEILSENEKKCIRIPMYENERSLNLSNSVAIVLYEALRQNDFLNLNLKGELHNLVYKS